jgi:hypothetical protein
MLASSLKPLESQPLFHYAPQEGLSVNHQGVSMLSSSSQRSQDTTKPNVLEFDDDQYYVRSMIEVSQQ